MAELMFVLLLGFGSIVSGVRGLRRGTLGLTPPRGVPNPPGHRELTGRTAIAGSIAAILIGVGLIIVAILRYRAPA